MAAYYFMTEEQWEKEKTYNLTDDQFLILNQIEYKESKRKAESLLRFLKKSIMLGDGSWTISFTKFHKFYNDWVNKHKKKRPSLKNISLTQLKFTVNRLKDLGLLIIEKNKKTNIYKLPATEKPTNNENITEGINTSLEANSSVPMISGSSYIDIDIYSKTEKNENKEFEADKYEKCTSLVDARRKAKELFNKFNVKNNWIKNRVLVTISYVYKNVTVRFLESYISKLIRNAREEYKKNWIKYTNIKVKQVKEANFTQREDYNWKELEQKLLGWN
ncbi:plasmid replication protein [Clostridium phage phiSM101]|uniref:plasmid replication protein n=2 Tax=root TaxID=1 RepID=UPI0000DB682F|nr:plasmid replication protein [Clostridium phage phiSM101]ABG87905.1 hypothetical protein CPR_C0040 [Clostridium phage phiSM101]